MRAGLPSVGGEQEGGGRAAVGFEEGRGVAPKEGSENEAIRIRAALCGGGGGDDRSEGVGKEVLWGPGRGRVQQRG